MEEPAGSLGPEGFWARLRRRKVAQWGLLYFAAAWGLAQGSAYLVDTFELPHRWQQAVALLLLAGLPITLTIAWFHGDRGHQKVGRVEATILLCLVGAGAVLLWQYPYTPRSEPQHETARSTAHSESSARPSIAVLPFSYRSNRKDDDYFAEGIQDDILTHLSQVRALRVISRNSIEQFRDSSLATREIGARLGVTNLLLGAVQRVGDRVRLSVQLVDVATDAQLWAESYERELTASNIFSVQSEVAAEVARALRASLTPAERAQAALAPTRNLQAWEAYQIGRLRQAQRSQAALVEAEGFFQRAIDLDPGFAAAHAALADNLLLQVDGEYTDRATALARAQALVDRALQLDPRLADAATAQASLAEAAGNLGRAEEWYRRAIELNPNYSRAYHWYGILLANQARLEDSLRYAEDAVRLDPLSAILQINLGKSREALGQFDDALAAYQKAVDIDPNLGRAHYNVGALHAFGHGRLDEGLPEIERAVQLDPDNPQYWLTLQFLRIQLGGSQGERAARDIAEAQKQGKPIAAFGAVLRSFDAGTLPQVRAIAERMYAEEPRGGLALVVLRNLAVQEGNLARARDIYLQAYPEFSANGPLALDRDSYRPAIDCALVLRRIGGADAQGNRLLDAADDFLRRHQAMGQDGYQAAGVDVLAIRGRDAQAIAALQDLERAGYFYAWRYIRDTDPAFDRIRKDPRFNEVFERIARRLSGQLARIEAREKSEGGT